MLVQRFDNAQIPSERVSIGGGGIRFGAQLTRSGVFEYTRADGTKVREYRPPDEVERADALASIEDIPVTVGHPPAGVSPDNFQRVAVGHVRNASRRDGKGVVIGGSVVVHRKDAVEGVKARKLVETSMGYGCRLDATPGVTSEGESYDVVQRDMTYNHLALLRAGAARLGTRVDSSEPDAGGFVMRLDSNGDQLAPDDSHGTSDDFTDTKAPIMKVTIKKDGKDHEVESGSPEHVAYLSARADAAEARLAAVSQEVETFKADAAERARATLETTARGVLGKSKDGKERKFDGKSDREVKAEVIAKRLPAIKLDGKDDAYVDHMFDAALAVSPSAPAAPKRGSQALVNAFSTSGARGDAADDDEDEDDKGKSKPAFLKKAEEMKAKKDSLHERS